MMIFNTPFVSGSASVRAADVGPTHAAPQASATAIPSVSEMAKAVVTLSTHRFVYALWDSRFAAQLTPKGGNSRTQPKGGNSKIQPRGGNKTVIGGIRKIKTPDETPRRDNDMDNPHIPGESGNTGPNRRNNDDDIGNGGSDSGMGGGDRGDPSP